MRKLVDLSQIIENDMPSYPGDINTTLVQTNNLAKDKYTNHKLVIGMHTGTHIDGPMHLIENGKYVSDLPLESFIAKGCILDVRNQPVIYLKAEYDNLVADNSIVLLYTGYDRYCGSPEYYEKHPVLDVDFCKYLLNKNIKMIGMDMPSPDRYPFEIHKLFLSNNVYIIENLTNLHMLLETKHFEVMAFPLKIKADGSLARVVARIP